MPRLPVEAHSSDGHQQPLALLPVLRVRSALARETPAARVTGFRSLGRPDPLTDALTKRAREPRPPAAPSPMRRVRWLTTSNGRDGGNRPRPASPQLAAAIMPVRLRIPSTEL